MAEDYYVFPRAGRANLYVQFRDPRTGKLGAARSSGKSSEAAAIRWAKAELRALQEQEVGRATKNTLMRDWAAPFFGPTCEYIARKKIDGVTYSTGYVKESRDYLERFILPDYICDLPLVSIRRIDVLAWRKRMVEKMGARRSAGKVLRVLKLILNEAVYNQLIEYSPAALVSAPAYEKHARDAIELETLAKMLDPKQYKDPRHWLATVLAAFTGMRASEIRALEWTALDFERRLIYVTQAFKDQSLKLGPPKNGKPRVAPMSPGLVKLLQEWKKTERKLKAGNSQWVFAASEHKAMGYKDWAYAVRKAAKAAGCEGATLHYLRHTLNTYLRGAGIDDEKLRASFGWSGPAIQENYSHPEKYDYSDQAAAIDRIIKIGGQDGKEGSSDPKHE